MSEQRTHTLIVGLACSGKTTLALRVAARQGLRVVHADDCRYSDASWTKRALLDYAEHVDAALSAGPSVFESSYLDASDATNARIEVLHALLPRAAAVVIITPDDAVTCLGRLVDRCIGRAAGTEPQGSCTETSLSRARLVRKFVTSYPAACAALDAFEAAAKEAGAAVVRGTRDELAAAWPEPRGRVYVAGAFRDWARVREVQAAARARGYAVSHDWTPSACVRYSRDETAAESAARKTADAERDLEGVVRADVVLALLTLPDYPYRGTLAEVTAALAMKKRVVVVDAWREGDAAPEYAKTVFLHHPRVQRVPDVDAALALL
jgi:nucleoside 2-deoxyribosyltransferase